jgi:hypothetical protein
MSDVPIFEGAKVQNFSKYFLKTSVKVLYIYLAYKVKVIVMKTEWEMPQKNVGIKFN